MLKPPKEQPMSDKARDEWLADAAASIRSIDDDALDAVRDLCDAAWKAKDRKALPTCKDVADRIGSPLSSTLSVLRRLCKAGVAKRIGPPRHYRYVTVRGEKP